MVKAAETTETDYDVPPVNVLPEICSASLLSVLETRGTKQQVAVTVA